MTTFSTYPHYWALLFLIQENLDWALNNQLVALQALATPKNSLNVFSNLYLKSASVDRITSAGPKALVPISKKLFISDPAALASSPIEPAASRTATTNWVQDPLD